MSGILSETQREKKTIVDCEDRGQTDRVTTLKRAGLRHWCWHRLRHAARLTALARS